MSRRTRVRGVDPEVEYLAGLGFVAWIVSTIGEGGGATFLVLRVV